MLVSITDFVVFIFEVLDDFEAGDISKAGELFIQGTDIDLIDTSEDMLFKGLVYVGVNFTGGEVLVKLV